MMFVCRTTSTARLNKMLARPAQGFDTHMGLHVPYLSGRVLTVLSDHRDAVYARLTCFDLALHREPDPDPDTDGPAPCQHTEALPCSSVPNLRACSQVHRRLPRALPQVRRSRRHLQPGRHVVPPPAACQHDVRAVWRRLGQVSQGRRRCCGQHQWRMRCARELPYKCCSSESGTICCPGPAVHDALSRSRSIGCSTPRACLLNRP